MHTTPPPPPERTDCPHHHPGAPQAGLTPGSPHTASQSWVGKEVLARCCLPASTRAWPSRGRVDCPDSSSTLLLTAVGSHARKNTISTVQEQRVGLNKGQCQVEGKPHKGMERKPFCLKYKRLTIPGAGNGNPHALLTRMQMAQSGQKKLLDIFL